MTRVGGCCRLSLLYGGKLLALKQLLLLLLSLRLGLLLLGLGELQIVQLLGGKLLLQNLVLQLGVILVQLTTGGRLLDGGRSYRLRRRVLHVELSVVGGGGGHQRATRLRNGSADAVQHSITSSSTAAAIAQHHRIGTGLVDALSGGGVAQRQVKLHRLATGASFSSTNCR